jgi:hypothetical protein
VHHYIKGDIYTRIRKIWEYGFQKSNRIYLIINYSQNTTHINTKPQNNPIIYDTGIVDA